MTFEELIISLFSAIKTNDVKKTQEYVSLINNFNDDNKKQNLSTILEIPRLDIDALNNQCYDYILLHLNFLENQDNIRWQRDINKLLMDNKIQNIENFIKQIFIENDYNITDAEKKWGLLKLIRALKNPEKIDYFLSILNI